MRHADDRNREHAAVGGGDTPTRPAAAGGPAAARAARLTRRPECTNYG